jgi:hypothetical protein
MQTGRFKAGVLSAFEIWGNIYLLLSNCGHMIIFEDKL